MRTAGRALMALCTIACMAACAAVVAGGIIGAGGITYINGELREDVNRSADKTYAATIRALKDLGMPVLEDRHDKLTARVKSRLATGEDVLISIDSVTGSTSKLGIRVGLIGDKYKSRMILDRINSNLK
ncbi:MAG: DUF3568 family protein [Nitrospiraceae bacterium]|nr:DUF3568 family protein [Nitrospiraceae bacterium]